MQLMFNMTLTQLTGIIDQGTPVIVLIQAVGTQQLSVSLLLMLPSCTPVARPLPRELGERLGCECQRFSVLFSGAAWRGCVSSRAHAQLTCDGMRRTATSS